MWKDKNLTFSSRQELVNFGGGVVGEVLDLDQKNALGEGRGFFLVLASDGAMTATGDPVIHFDLEHADNPAFTNARRDRVFSGLAKTDFGANGKLLVQTCPMGIQRYVRLVMETNLPIACVDFTAMLTIDAQTNDRGVELRGRQ